MSRSHRPYGNGGFRPIGYDIKEFHFTSEDEVVALAHNGDVYRNGSVSWRNQGYLDIALDAADRLIMYRYNGKLIRSKESFGRGGFERLAENVSGFHVGPRGIRVIGNDWASLTVDGTLVVSGSIGNDMLDIRRDNGRIRIVGRPIVVDGVKHDSVGARSVREIKVLAGDGDDRVHLDLGAEAIDVPVLVLGGNGNDSLVGATSAPNTLLGGAGNDDLHGWNGNDRLHGGSGDDLIHAGAGDDVLFGEGGDDTLHGHSGNDTLFSGEGDDWLYGGKGDDVLVAIGSMYLGVGDDHYLVPNNGDENHVGGGHGDDVLRWGEAEDEVFRLEEGFLDDLESFAKHLARIVTIPLTWTAGTMLGGVAGGIGLGWAYHGDEYVDTAKDWLEFGLPTAASMATGGLLAPELTKALSFESTFAKGLVTGAVSSTASQLASMPFNNGQFSFKSLFIGAGAGVLGQYVKHWTTNEPIQTQEQLSEAISELNMDPNGMLLADNVYMRHALESQLYYTGQFAPEFGLFSPFPPGGADGLLDAIACGVEIYGYVPTSLPTTLMATIKRQFMLLRSLNNSYYDSSCSFLLP